MNHLKSLSKFVPCLYYIAVVAFWFTMVNRTEGVTAYPILLFGIPFLWQIIKPNRNLNFVLGITFVCLSSYLILAFLFNLIDSVNAKYLLYFGLFVVANFLMALWMVRNSLNRTF
jgi:hypothetical protein